MNKIDLPAAPTAQVRKLTRLHAARGQVAELCPEGVEFKSIGEICQINRGRVVSKDYLRDNAGEYPVYSSQTVDDGVFGSINTCDYDGEYLTWTTDGANAGSIFYRNGKFSITNVCGLLKVKVDGVNTKFLLYILATVSKKYVSAGMGNPKIMSNVMEKIKIPIPPLAVQQEIVKILDTFATLEAELETELETELEARRKQYEYYRDELLMFDNRVCFVKLSEMFTMRNGYTPSKANKDFWTNSTLPWFRMDDIRQNGRILTDSLQHITPQAIKGKLFPAGSIIMATTATIGVHALLIADSLANQRFTFFTKNVNRSLPEIDMKYAFYYFFIIDEWCTQNTQVSSFPSVDIGKLKNYEMPVPPIEEQRRIVKILDKFDALVNDISVGLPAELNARRKQYEYYRDGKWGQRPIFRRKNRALSPFSQS